MRDRQDFEKTVLPNGITVYTYRLDSPIVSLELQLPVGAAHSHAGNDFLQGSVHFLEHLQLIRSRKYPSAHQLNKELGLRGGHFNGSTYRSKTTYSIDAPASELEFACKALVDRVYHPIFRKEDIDLERTIVVNERERDKFYPGRNKASQYYNTEFMFDMPYPLEQLYGSNDSLAAINVKRLEEMHRIIARTPGAIAIAVGNSDFACLKEELARIETSTGLLNKKMNDTVWKDPSFRLVEFDTVTRPTLEVAWIHPRVTPAERTNISFVLSLLTNHVHGTLFHEFRHRRGWLYRLDNYIANHKQTMFGMTFPVNNVKQIEFIRTHLHERILTAIHDQRTVNQEIRRRLNNQVYNYQTTGSIMAQASRDLIGNKKIFTENEWQEAIIAMIDLPNREKIIAQFFKQEEMGEIGFTSA